MDLICTFIKISHDNIPSSEITILGDIIESGILENHRTYFGTWQYLRISQYLMKLRVLLQYLRRSEAEN